MKYFRLLTVLAFIVSSFAVAQVANNYKWMTVGSLQNLYSNYGSEIETGRTGKDADQADGCRWPAIYRTQDMQAAKAIWIGTSNYSEPKGTFPFKVVHVGPRNTAGAFPGETFPVVFKMISKYQPTQVLVDGVLSYGTLAENDDVDPTLKWDRMIDNVAQTPIGLTIHRKVIAFSQQYHDNYIIYDYTFTNTGIIDDKNTTRTAKTLTDVYFYFQNRFGINRDVQPVIGDPVAYGKNTVNDVRGDTSNPGPAKYFPTNTDNNDLRVSFAWHGYYPAFTGGYDNIGAPIFKQATGHIAGDTVGRLGAYQFVGWATLHADKSTIDTSDDLHQPSTTSYTGSDGSTTSANDAGSIDQYNATAMALQWKMITKGHMIPRHADLLTPTSGDPALGTSGGQSMAMGYGPYTMAPSESIHLVIAEVAAGLSRDASIQIGRAFKASTAAPITYNGVTKSKNDWVFTGKDSLFQSVRRALANYQSNWSIPLGPPPPTTVNVASKANKIHLDWTAPSDVTKINGWQVWRASAQYDSTYYKIWDGPKSAASFDDTLATFDAAYYYYVVSVGNALDNTAVGNTPAGILTSSRYYTQTYAPAYRRLGAPLVLDKSKVRIVPNPYNLGAASNLLWPGQQDKIVFKNIPGICTIKIYSELGELIKTIEHTDETGSQDYNLTTSSKQIIVSGIYIAVVETPQGNRGIYKFVVIR